MTESEPAALPLGYAPGWLVWLAKLSPSVGYCQVAGPPKEKFAVCWAPIPGSDPIRRRLAQHRFSPSDRDMGMDWWTEQAKALRERIDRGERFKWFVPYVDGPSAV